MTHFFEAVDVTYFQHDGQRQDLPDPGHGLKPAELLFEPHLRQNLFFNIEDGFVQKFNGAQMILGHERQIGFKHPDNVFIHEFF